VPQVPTQRPLLIAAYGARDLLIGVIFLYGFVYSAYKFGNPLFGRNDFFKYKEMVANPFDFSATTAPFVLRQIPAIVAAAFYKLGMHYDTAAVVDLIGFDRDTKRRFLALIVSNALAVCLSFSILAGYLRAKLARNSLLDLFALFGIFAAGYYFSAAVIAPVTVGWGWLVSSLLAIAFLERNFALTCMVCVIALFARETMLVFALVLFAARLAWESERHRSDVLSVVALAACCLIYLLLRSQFTTGYEYQISPTAILDNLKTLAIPPGFLYQSIFTQALPAFLLLCIAYKEPRYAAYLLLATGAVTAVALGARVSQTAMLWAESLPVYSVVFFITQRDGATKAEAKIPGSL
jgi:hypothetical protein